MPRIRTTLLITAALLLASPMILGTATADDPTIEAEQDAEVPGYCVYVDPSGTPPIEVYPCKIELPPV